MQQIASNNAPSAYVVVPHFMIGAIAWLIATVLIIIFPDAFTQHFFNPKLLAVTHLLVIGFFTMVIFGALYQLIPVILETKLFSEKLALSSLFLLGSGAILLTVSFWNFWFGAHIHIAASLILLGVSLFAINVFATASRSEKNSVERDFILTAVIWLVFTIIAGFALAYNLSHPFLSQPHIELLKLHSHAGIIGWFLQLIIGVSSRLLPMFMVSHNLNPKKLRVAYYLINAGLVTGIVSLFMQWPVGVTSAIVLSISGILFYLSFIFEAYKKRVKKGLDIGMKQSALSFFILLIGMVLLIILTGNFEELRNFTAPMSVAYGSTLLLGFISSLIMGQTYKTLPFIVWLKVYKNRMGKGKIPFPKELYSENVAVLQAWTFAAGFLVMIAGIFTQQLIVVSTAGIVLFCAVLLYNFNILKIVFHKPVNLNSKT